MRLGPKSTTKVLLKEPHEVSYTEKRMPCGDGGRGWSVAAASQGIPSIAGSHRKLGGRPGYCFSQSLQKGSILPTP